MKAAKIAVLGLGYVGLPLAEAFSWRYSVVGYDISQQRIKNLCQGKDKTKELSTETICAAIKRGLVFTGDTNQIADCSVFIITVPTPVDAYKKPDLSHLYKATATVGKVLKKKDIVIYESTVYPGCTEEDCVPILEKTSGLKFNADFFCGYSPERINPGDKVRVLKTILKITSGSTPDTAKQVDDLYKSIITAGTYLAPSIKIAEAAKIIENTQRDVNISLINELALIFDKMNIDTLEVLKAAGTKWNFLPFRPGLVGGHCIGVDPSYLAFKAEQLGYKPHVILSGRSVNDNMGVYIANRVVKLMTTNDLKIKHSKVLVLGITFKENCPDIRNSRVIDVVQELQSFGMKVDVYDPLADSKDVETEYGLSLITTLKAKYEAIILAVSHNDFLTLDIKALKKSEKSVVYDVKSVLPKNMVTDRL